MEGEQGDGVLGIKEIFAQHWVAGVRGGGSGTTVQVTLAPPRADGLELESLCMIVEKTVQRARLQKKRDDVFVANFRGTANLTGGERLAEDDSISSPALPVDVGKGQAVIMYRLGGEAREMTVDVQTRPMIPYPECPPPRHERPC